LGEFWTPAGVTQEFVQNLTAEMNALVYDLDLLPSGGRGCTLIDCGANIGVFARWALRQKVERVICFEPSPQNAVCLRRNLAEAIREGRAEVFQRGLWDFTGTLSFSTNVLANPGAHHVVEDGSGNITIEVVSLDEALRGLSVERVDYIKIDVEGSERRAIAGASNTIRRCHPQLCVVTEHTSDLYANAIEVIESIKRLNLGYRYRVNEAHPYSSPSKGNVMTPYSILFCPSKQLGAIIQAKNRWPPMRGRVDAKR
jgi:FkbM family methyltransferase